MSRDIEFFQILMGALEHDLQILDKLRFEQVDELASRRTVAASKIRDLEQVCSVILNVLSHWEDEGIGPISPGETKISLGPFLTALSDVSEMKRFRFLLRDVNWSDVLDRLFLLKMALQLCDQPEKERNECLPLLHPSQRQLLDQILSIDSRLETHINEYQKQIDIIPLITNIFQADPDQPYDLPFISVPLQSLSLEETTQFSHFFSAKADKTPEASVSDPESDHQKTRDRLLAEATFLEKLVRKRSWEKQKKMCEKAGKWHIRTISRVALPRDLAKEEIKLLSFRLYDLYIAAEKAKASFIQVINAKLVEHQSLLRTMATLGLLPSVSMLESFQHSVNSSSLKVGLGTADQHRLEDLLQQRASAESRIQALDMILSTPAGSNSFSEVVEIPSLHLSLQSIKTKESGEKILNAIRAHVDVLRQRDGSDLGQSSAAGCKKKKRKNAHAEVAEIPSKSKDMSQKGITREFSRSAALLEQFLSSLSSPSCSTREKKKQKSAAVVIKETGTILIPAQKVSRDQLSREEIKQFKLIRKVETKQLSQLTQEYEKLTERVREKVDFILQIARTHCSAEPEIAVPDHLKGNSQQLSVPLHRILNNQPERCLDVVADPLFSLPIAVLTLPDSQKLWKSYVRSIIQLLRRDMDGVPSQQQLQQCVVPMVKLLRTLPVNDKIVSQLEKLNSLLSRTISTSTTLIHPHLIWVGAAPTSPPSSVEFHGKVSHLLSEADREGLLLLSQLLSATTHAHSAVLPACPQSCRKLFDETKSIQVLEMLEMAKANSELNSRLEVVLKQSRMPFGISRKALLFLRSFSFKSRHLDKLPLLSLKLQRGWDELLRQEAAGIPLMMCKLDRADRIKLSELAVLRTMEKWGKELLQLRDALFGCISYSRASSILASSLSPQLDLVTGLRSVDSTPENNCHPMQQQLIQAVEAHAVLVQTFDRIQQYLNADQTYRSGDILLTLWSKKQKTMQGNRPPASFRFLMNFTRYEHTAVIYRNINKQFGLEGELRFSHMFRRYHDSGVMVEDLAASEVYRLQVAKLVAKGWDEKLQKLLGDDWQQSLESRFESIQAKLHSESSELLGTFVNPLSRVMGIGTAAVLPWTKQQKQPHDFAKITSQVILPEEMDSSGEMSSEETAMTCSEFAIVTTIAVLVKLNEALAKELGESASFTLTNPIIQIPFPQKEKYSKMQPERLLELLRRHVRPIPLPPLLSMLIRN